MAEYVTTERCLMQFLREQLDDPGAAPCGRCSRCTARALPTTVPERLVAAAVAHLRSQPLEIRPRRQWPRGLDAASGKLPVALQAEPGRALALFGDPGWGGLVRSGKFLDGRFADELVDATAELVTRRWQPEPAPQWVTCVPSRRRPELVPGFAQRLAGRLRLPFHPIVVKVRETRPQKEMENSVQQAANVHGAFALEAAPDRRPVLLVDDIVDSRWTLTVVAALLREAGGGPVHPLALADAQPG